MKIFLINMYCFCSLINKHKYTDANGIYSCLIMTIVIAVICSSLSVINETWKAVKLKCNDLIADPNQGRASKMFMDYKTLRLLTVSVCQGLQTILLTLWQLHQTFTTLQPAAKQLNPFFNIKYHLQIIWHLCWKT